MKVTMGKIAFASASVAAIFLSACFDPTAPTQSSDADKNELSYGFSVASGTYNLVSVNSGKCADVAGASTSDGANIQQWTCHNSTNQQWKLSDLGGGIFTVVSVNSGKCADVYQAGTADGVNIQQWKCNGGSNQKWKAVDMGSGQYELVAQNSGKCMDVSGVSLSDGANIHQWTCKGNANQKWKLVPVGSTTPPPPSGAPTASQLLAKTTSCNQASNGKYATDDGGPSTVAICKLNGAFFWKADMDVDCDGKRTSVCNENVDPWYQNQTSFTTSTGGWLDASTLPYVVIPLPSSRFDYTKNGIQAGQVVAVIYNGKVVYGVFGDEGPSNIIGESSYAMAKALGIDPDPATGGVDNGVTYMVFTGSSGVVNPIEDHSKATSVGISRANWVLNNN